MFMRHFGRLQFSTFPRPKGSRCQELAQELHGDIKNYGMILDAVTNTASVPIEFESWEGGQRGYVQFC